MKLTCKGIVTGLMIMVGFLTGFNLMCMFTP